MALCAVIKTMKVDCNHFMRTTTPMFCVGVVDCLLNCQIEKPFYTSKLYYFTKVFLRCRFFIEQGILYGKKIFCA